MFIEKVKVTAVACSLILVGSFLANVAETNDTRAVVDTRTMVKLPEHLKTKMLTNMRDHIYALDDIIRAVRAGEYERAQGIADSRLGRSSFELSGDQKVAEYWPEPMQIMADQMYKAGSNFVVLAQNASVDESVENYKNVIGALGEVTSACRSCHETYRLR